LSLLNPLGLKNQWYKTVQIFEIFETVFKAIFSISQWKKGCVSVGVWVSLAEGKVWHAGGSVCVTVWRIQAAHNKY